ncbi:DNA-processing protein DprA [Thermoproteus tenax]|uniref:Rossmann fold nucleotide-binding protein involved in DNA uptake (Dpra) n=1 Tax=Thermoproteus tenax (strain ATCC 35583 / DSM 2078 / JCM 9277 / NBRC 100435 / Kra 1) TaxID=768679 RepID=G4RMX4_THETK|nr:DNA-processing protein DprA [Thermoproteus tenax]CCC80918.1 Rossmann fold nucleotide-binding protein involved in DNA uptake (Dpra) [Thermoproteus tenax Kra 1]
METREYVTLLHGAWSKWDRIKRLVYRELGVRNTEELIRRFVDVESCRPLDVETLASALRKFVEPADPGAFATPFFDPRYPCELLRYPAYGDVLYPPLMLYWSREFNANERPAVAVVGTRRCSSWGRKTARELGRALASRGYAVVTGLAECVDAEAARGALDAGGIVVGVRPWLRPLELPRESAPLAKRVVIVSERLEKPRGDVRRLYFLRNRIIAGMAKAVVVVEAREGGGTMHQIELGLRRGKPVYIMKPASEDYLPAYKAFLEKGAEEVEDIAQLLRYVQRA